jgi:SAM-dependent methyltransferase
MDENIWSEFARSYDGVIPRLHCYQRMLVKIVRDVALTTGLVIDAGGGTGLVSQALLDRGRAVYTFDNNPGMLEQAHARKRAKSLELQARWTIEGGDVRSFPASAPLEAGAVVMNNVLFYVRDSRTVVENAFRHLAPEGIFIATGPKQRPDLAKVYQASVAEWNANGEFTPELQQALSHFAQVSKTLTTDPNEMVTFFQPDELVELLRQIGFRQVVAADGDDYFGENFYVAMRK